MKRFYFGNGNTIADTKVPESIANAMVKYIAENGINSLSEFNAIYDDAFFSLFGNGTLVALGSVSRETTNVCFIEISPRVCNTIAGKEGEFPSIIAYALIPADYPLVLIRFRDRFVTVKKEDIDIVHGTKYNGLDIFAYGFKFPEFDGKRVTLKEAYSCYNYAMLDDDTIIDTTNPLFSAYDVTADGRLYHRYFADNSAMFISDYSHNRYVNRLKKTLDSGEVVANIYSETRYIVQCEHCGRETLSFRGSGLCHACYNLLPHHICPICGNETVEESGYHRDCITRVGGYHDSHEYERTFYTDSEGNLCFGVENELKFGTQFDRDAYLKAMRSEFGEMFHFERDGSLSGVACETISEPMDLDYFLNNKIWQRVANNIRKGHGRHDRETGCHIHISREAFSSDDAIMAYLLMMNNPEIYDILTTGSGRDRHDTSYHSRYRYDIRDCDLEDFNSHSYCFTVSSDTVECRCYEAFTSGIQYKRIVLVTLGMVNVANALESDLDKAASMDGKTLYGLLKVWRRDSATAFKTFAERAGKNTGDWL